MSLTPKAFEMLLFLVESEGRVLSKDELMHQLWPDSFVEEANLSHNIYKLREALGEREGEKYIETLPRRGYRFVAHVTRIRDERLDLIVEESAATRVIIDDDQYAHPAPNADATRREPATRSLPGATHGITKRIRFAVLVGGLVLLLGLGYVWLRRNISQPATLVLPLRSIAVLPFEALSAESPDEALELGMADALITKLSNVKQIAVRPTSAVLKYIGRKPDVFAVGREQAVDAVIEGKVQKAGGRVRLTVQLIKATDGIPLWAGEFDAKLTDVFAVQDSISEQVVRALVLKLTTDEKLQLAKHYTDNIEAYQLYQIGRGHWAKFSDVELRKSIEYYNRAVALDPNYALAYAGLSYAYSVQGAFEALPPSDTLPKAKQAAERALKLDDTLAEAHTALGGVELFYERDWPRARAQFERAIELDPSFPDSHQLYGYYWEVVGQLDKAEEALKDAQKLGPLMPIISMDLANLDYYERRYDEAINLYRKAQEIDPDFIPLPFFIGQTYERKGAYSEAISECETALALRKDDPSVLSTLAYAYAQDGRGDEASATLKKLTSLLKQRYVSPFLMGLAFAGLGDNDQAMIWLNKAYNEHDPQLIWVALEPQLEGLHDDPRFKDLLRRMDIKS